MVVLPVSLDKIQMTAGSSPLGLRVLACGSIFCLRSPECILKLGDAPFFEDGQLGALEPIMHKLSGGFKYLRQVGGFTNV